MNRSHVLSFNERRVLALLRQEPLARAELARLTGLSAPGVTSIVRKLVADGLVRALAPVRGGVGPPSVPLALDPRGAYALGLAVGRRGGELALVDFAGEIVARVRRSWAWPEIPGITAFVVESFPALTAKVPASRLYGLGVALPSNLWQWHERLEAPAEALGAWHEHDLGGELACATGLRVRLGNDATAAAGAELTYGRGTLLGDFAYFSIGFFIGGGLVIDGVVHAGRHGRGAEFGSLPVLAAGGRNRPVQLIDEASLHVLETMLDERAQSDPPPERAADGPDRPSRLIDACSDDWHEDVATVGRWEKRAAEAMATAIASVTAVVDLDHIVIDGIVPTPVLTRLCSRVRAALGRLDTRGLSVPAVIEGTLGSEAAPLGAARLTLLDALLAAPIGMSGSSQDRAPARRVSPPRA